VKVQADVAPLPVASVQLLAEPGLDLILIRVLPPSLFPQDRACTCANDLPPETAGGRWEPLGSDGVWTKRGPPPLWLWRLSGHRYLGAAVAVDSATIDRVAWEQAPATTAPRVAVRVLGLINVIL
jgi:hypothetical protein